MKILWTEHERHTMERYYWLQLKHHPAPRAVRKMMAERLALMNLQQLAQQEETAQNARTATSSLG